MAMFKVLTIGEKEYKLKLNTNATILVEDKLGENILNQILGMQSAVDSKGKLKTDGLNKMPIPSIKYMVTILWGALQPFHHGMTFAKTCDLVDEYIENGKTQLDLFIEVMDILTTSGILGNPEENENLK